MSETPFQDAIDLLNTHDGMRFEGVKDLIAKMKYSDIKLITDFCIRRERQIGMDVLRDYENKVTGLKRSLQYSSESR